MMSTSGAAVCACAMAGSGDLKDRVYNELPNLSRFQVRWTRSKIKSAAEHQNRAPRHKELNFLGKLGSETGVRLRSQGLQAALLGVAQGQRFDECCEGLFVYRTSA